MFKSFDVVTESMDAFLNEAKITTGNGFDYSYYSMPPEMQKRVLAMVAKNGLTEEDFLANYKASIVNSPSGEVSARSISSKNLINSAMKQAIELYDKDKDEAILASENLVEAYNAVNMAHFEKANVEVTKAYTKIHNIGKNIDHSKPNSESRSFMDSGANAICGLLDLMGQDRAQLQITDAELIKLIFNAMYDPTDDPEKIKKIIKMRLDYNKLMIHMFTAMLHSNWSILGLSKDQALALTERIQSDDQEVRHQGIKEMKETVLKNKSKFDNGRYVDLRALGGGCVFVTKAHTGFENYVSIDRLLQESLRYDAIVACHGFSENKKSMAYRKEFESMIDAVKKELEDFKDERVKIIDKTNDAFASKNDAAKKLDELKAQLASLDKNSESLSDEDINKLTADISKMSDKMNAYNNANIEGHGDLAKINRKVAAMDQEILNLTTEFVIKSRKMNTGILSKPKWTMQPVYTTKAGPFEDMNDCIRQLVKEGFKKIKIIACNPGHHELDADIKKMKDVEISMVKNILLLENVQADEDDPYSILEAAIYRTENDLNCLKACLNTDPDDRIVSYTKKRN